VPVSSYDALLVVSFGGPESPEEVMPFLERVVRGRNVPRARLEEVAEHYHHFGGRSPINDQNRALIAALDGALANAGQAMPIYFGNRNWHPLLEDTVRDMQRDGVGRALAFITSAFGSYSGCRQYREDIDRACGAAGADAPVIDPIRRFYDHPLFIRAVAARIEAAVADLGTARWRDASLVFTAHSIPLSMARTSPYEQHLGEAARLVGERVGHPSWDLAWQSRSGPPHVSWLEPDILDHLRALAERGVKDVVVSPLGFLSDHMEVAYDLDVEASELARELGLGFVRVPTPGVHPDLVAMILELIGERTGAAPRRHLGLAPDHLAPDHSAPDYCAPDCCPAPSPRS
jgi:ferrochelatase